MLLCMLMEIVVDFKGICLLVYYMYLNLKEGYKTNKIHFLTTLQFRKIYIFILICKSTQSHNIMVSIYSFLSYPNASRDLKDNNLVVSKNIIE